MARRLGIILATTVVALLVMTDGAWACRCMNRLINRCGHRRACCRVCVQPSCCQPTCCQAVTPACCQPASGEMKAAAGAANVVSPSANNPAAGGTAVEKKPEIKPEEKPALPPPPKTEPMPPAGPVEKPAEIRVAPKPDAPKPDAPKPDAPKPDVVTPDAPKAPEAPKPDAPKPDAPKPDAPKAPKAPEKKPAEKEDPFGSNDSKTLRMWTDASGKYQVEGRFVSFQDGTVRLQKANGRYVRVVYGQLCSVDQDFVLNQDQSLLAME
jgi:hypothetical protein